jgi:hypothetical protein
MRRIELFFTAILIILSFNNTSSFSQDDNKDASMKAYMDYMTPGKEHQMLAKQTGDWKFDGPCRTACIGKRNCYF